MRVNESLLKKVLFHQYDFFVDQLIPLSGFYDKNYQIICGSKKYFLKIYGFDKFPAIRFQLDLIQKCVRAKLPVAKIIPTKKRRLLFPFSNHYGVVQEFLDGKQLRTVKMTSARLKEAGYLLGSLHRMTHKSAFHGSAWKKYPWDLSQFSTVVKDYKSCKNYLAPDIQMLVERVIGEWKKNKSSLKNLRKGVCHNDYHHGNILMTKTGRLMLTDFGDAMKTWYAADVAIALAHLCFEFDGGGAPNLLMNAFLEGYNKQFSLTLKEKKALPLLTQMRAVTIIVEVPLRLKKQNRHELYDTIVATKRNVLEYFLKQN